MTNRRDKASEHDELTTIGTPDGLPPLMTQPQLANLLLVSERKLERDRHDGTGVAFIKVGRRVLYRREDVTAYLKANRYASTSEVRNKKKRSALDGQAPKVISNLNIGNERPPTAE